MIQTKSGALLEALLQRAGDVSRDTELSDLLWPDEDVEESNLSQHVFMLRSTFAQATPDLTVIVTVHRKGYRFVLPVEPGGPRASLSVKIAGAGTFKACFLPSSVRLTDSKKRSIISSAH